MVDMQKSEKNIVNILRRIILRLRPYMSLSSSPQIAFKTLEIYQNLIKFLNQKEMTIESDAKGMFQSEDQSNVIIPCCLAATTHEIFDNFKSIL